MTILTADKLGVSFGENTLFENVSFSINQGDKVSIVGVNGAGKTTLLRLFYHPDARHSGSVYISKGKTIGCLEQQSNLDPNISVYEAALSVFSSLSEMEQRLEQMSDRLKHDHSEEAIARFSSLQARFESEGGYEYKSRARGTLVRMGFDETMLSLPVAALSGGQKTILQLSLLLLEEPDILLLDEPTNHLDVKALEWLEDSLKRIRSTLVVISHDRLFLDRVTQKTIELENGHAKLYPVPYSQYREQKKIEREIQERHYKNQQKEIARIQAFIEQQKRWNREKNIIAAESRQKALDRMVKVEKVENAPDSLSFHFSEAIESGNDVLSVRELSKRYGSNVLFSDLSFEVKKNDRLIVIGANGSGKSTLLQILAGNLSQDSGTFRYGYNVKIGYYDQYQRLNDNNTVLEEIWEDCALTQTEIRSLLATFLFKGDDVFKEVRVLSGGERARLVLAKLMKKKVNLLLLDEPTNHLDIESREALEEALLEFDGTVIAVSHDRYFIRKIATALIDFQGSGSTFCYQDGYEAYCDYRNGKESDTNTSLCNIKSESASDWQAQKKLKQEERKKKARMEKIEKEIEAAESRIHEIDLISEENANDYLLLQKLYEEKEDLRAKCDLLLMEWGELSDV